jgi:hypothetical protein
MLNAVVERDGELFVDFDYFEVEEPHRWDDGTTYTEGSPKLELLREHREAEFQPYASMTRGDDGFYRLPEKWRNRVPLTFSLRARAVG